MAIYDILEELEKKIEYTFNDKSLLKLALTHKSYAHEKKIIDKNLYNERIEFLGDAILELIISEELYNINPIINEGEMTKKRAEIVCEKSLSNAFKTIDAEKYLFLGKCEIVTDGRRKDAIIADAFEAVLGAIYLDSNLNSAKKVVLNLLGKQIKDILDGKNNIIDYKTKLQEVLQQKGSMNIRYTILDEKGPDHNKEFTCNVIIDNVEDGIGVGKNRKIAEQQAAKIAYEKRV